VAVLVVSLGLGLVCSKADVPPVNLGNNSTGQ